MLDLLILVVHIITTVLRLARPGGLRAVVAESVLTKHQMLILNRSRRRAPNLRIQDLSFAKIAKSRRYSETKIVPMTALRPQAGISSVNVRLYEYDLDAPSSSAGRS